MNKIEVLSIAGVLLAGWLGSSASHAQEPCVPVVLGLDWQGIATQPALVTVAVLSEGVAVVPVFTVPFNGPQAWEETWCLEPGCYEVVLGANVPLNGDLLDWDLSGEGLETGWLSDGPQQWVLAVCVPEAATDCPDEIDFAQGEGCAWAFEIGGFVPGESVLWTFGDGTSVEGGHFVQHVFPEDGGYGVTAVYTSSLCPGGVTLQTEVEVTGCSETTNCTWVPVTNDAGCNVWEVGFPELPVGSSVVWTAGNQILGDGPWTAFAPDWSVIEAECVPVVAQLAVPGCPTQAVTVLLCEEDCTEGCPIEVAAEQVMPGVWMFSAVGPGGGLWDGPLVWSLGEAGEAVGNPVVWTWEGEPGVYVVCVEGAATPACPEGAAACTEVESGALACEEVTLSISPSGAVVSGFGMTFTLEANWLGLPVGGWDWAESWECGAGWTGDTVTLCLPALCYDLLLDAPAWAWAELGTLLGDASGMPLQWTSEWTGQTLPLNAACTAAVSPPRHPTPEATVHPNPAEEHVTVSCAAETAVRWEIRSATGALQSAGTGRSPMRFEVTTWTSGWYFIHLQTPDGTTTKKFAVSH